jgi:hypothetical protein
MLSEAFGVSSDLFGAVSSSSPSARNASSGWPVRASIHRKADSSEVDAQSLRPSAVQMSHGANVMLPGRYRMMRTAPAMSTRQTRGAISLTAQSIALPPNPDAFPTSATFAVFPVSVFFKRTPVSARLILVEHILAGGRKLRLARQGEVAARIAMKRRLRLAMRQLRQCAWRVSRATPAASRSMRISMRWPRKVRLRNVSDFQLEGRTGAYASMSPCSRMRSPLNP